MLFRASFEKKGEYFDVCGYERLVEINPAEYIQDPISTDSVRERDDLKARMEHIHKQWAFSQGSLAVKSEIESALSRSQKQGSVIQIVRLGNKTDL